MKKNVINIFTLFLIFFFIPIISNFNSLREYHSNKESFNSFALLNSSQWESRVTLDVGNHPVSVFVGDTNNDGQNDIVTCNQADNSISILLWNSTILDWDSEITKEVGISPESVAIGDVNNDGLNDITVSSIENFVSILLWNSSTKNWTKIIKTVGDDPEAVVIGDANNDGQNDIVTANMGDYDISILLWNTSTEDWNPQITKHVGYVPYSVFLGDVDNDGDNDIVTANYGIDNNISILLWNSSSLDWSEKETRYAGNSPYCVFIEDANNDGMNDIIASSLDNTVLILCWNDSTNNWNNPIEHVVGSNPRSIFVGDVNNDDQNDIVSANYYDDNVSVLLWNTVLSDWELGITLSVGNRPHSIFVEDVNNDGWNDIITANYNDNTVSILLGNIYQLNTPNLDVITPNPDNDGYISLNWSKISGANNYLIYRNDYYILSTFGLTPVAVVNESNYHDLIHMNGDYYYVVVAINSTAISSISNCESIVVSIPLSTPILDPILPNISHNGKVYLNWNDILGARIYYIYRDDTNITNSEEASLIAQTTDSNYTDTISVNGIYYYIIIAGDFSLNSSISNCIEVKIEIRSNLSISGYFFFNNLLILAISAVLILVKVKFSSKLKILHSL